MRKPLEAPLNNRELTALIILLIMTMAPHVLHLNGWISGFFIAAVFLRLVALKTPKALPGRFLLFLLTAGGLTNVLAHYPLLMGKEAGVALLTSMMGLKLLELKTRRDLFITVFLAFFTLVTLFLFRQEIALVGYVLLVAWGLGAVLVEASRSEHSANLLVPLRKSGIMLLQAVPVMIVLFVFFPRFTGPLWNLGFDSRAATAGLSDRISPGSISKLILSEEVAFRVNFEDKIPPNSNLYWRGPVLWQTDGFYWNEGPQQRPRKLKLQVAGEPVAHTVTLEPTHRRWLFALDLPQKRPPNSIHMPDFQLLNLKPLDQRIRYSLTSWTEYNTGPLQEDELQRGLQLPPNITPRMEELVAGWKAEAEGPVEIVETALKFFREQPFFYTLIPPLTLDNPADEFLFETRRGFCEHYATSFTLLMRLVGIPTRVVTGYQGGELNPMGGYLVVRQADAHAWSEVWLAGSGWVRIDPTAAVAPQRIDRSFNPNIDRSFDIGEPIKFNLKESDLVKRLVNQLRWGWDSINSSWHNWVLGYTMERQGSLMAMLGFSFLRGYKLALGMVLITATVVFGLAILLWNQTIIKTDPIQKAFLRYCKKLSRIGIVRNPWEGPRDLATRVIKLRPDLATDVARITSLYIAMRYGNEGGQQKLRRLQMQVQAFRPSRRPAG
ncbi:transglutaminase TgpA family protein [Solemya velesiana gill symbiont]|uniref:Transglutaminase-like domain-containing protein n=1 Tax=Solemya velesiana gill symbiont TaxID=1918948 RepID=A0A1T2KXH5_9GAMM|nr:DUF3488 and transglutaminase-like domain-containing protein [Solemya velesiana gill symbiont]OOZ37559.1 hypothetical protein BOW51_01735 [Solemya velesiana gill symbiont]